jgi:hypothetical protein
MIRGDDEERRKWDVSDCERGIGMESVSMHVSASASASKRVRE